MASLINSLLQLQNLVSPYGVTAPTVDGSFDGQLYLQIGGATELYRKSLWQWNGSEWQWVFGSVLIGTANPNGAYTPDGIGQQFKNTTSGLVYTAQGLTNNDWGVDN